MTDQEATPNVLADFRYDAQGRLVEKVADGTTTRYYHDGVRIVGETASMANEEKISKWWFWAFPALANLFLLVGIILLMAGRISYWTLGYPPKPLHVAWDAFLRVASVLATWIYEPVRRALGLGHRHFYSPFTIVFIWELVAFAGGLLCYAVGLLCHNVAAMRRRAPNGEGQQPRDRGQS